MNLRVLSLAIFVLNLCAMQSSFADKGHIHNHHLNPVDRELLMYGTREKLAEGYSQKCDEIHQLRDKVKDLKEEHWQFKLFAKGVGTGVILSGAAAAIIWVCNQ